MRALVFFLLLSVARAAEPDAIAIDSILQFRHQPFGTILDPIFTAPDSEEIANYTRCGDSALWTGHYLAAEAFRYKVTGSGEALSNASHALDGLTLLTDVTGTNVLARCAVPVDSKYAPSIIDQEKANGIFIGSASGQTWYWIGNTSRDEYIGVFFGLGVAYNLITDTAFRSRVS